MDGLRARLALLVGTATMAVAGLGVPVAQGAVGDAVLDSCLNPGPAQSPCTSESGLTEPFPEALSPDGRQLYVASNGGTPTGGSMEEPTILIFDRDPATGALTRRRNLGCVTPSGSAGACVAASMLNYPQDIAMSPDGHSVYVSNYGNSSIIEFERASDGGLTLMSQCQATTGPCNVPVGMETPNALGFSPDGTTLYARTGGNSGQGTLLAFSRAPDGTLTQLAAPEGCWSEVAQANCRTATGISDQATQIAVTEKNVYVTGHDDLYYYLTGGCGSYCVNTVPPSGTVAIFGRHSDGSLTQAPAPNGCIGDSGADGGVPFSGPAPHNCQNGSDALYQARSVTVSPDGQSVYVGADNAIVAYSRDASGGLTEIGCLQKEGVAYPGCVTATGIEAVYRMAVSPSGDELVSDIFNNNGGLAFMSRDPATGAIAQLEGTRGCISSSSYGGKCQVLGTFGRESSIAFSSDSHFIYATANKNGLLATFHRDRAPSCEARTVSVPYQTSIAVPLACTDPDGDPVTMAIVHQPTAGSLGGNGTIDTSNDTVRYNPPLGYTGPDSFEYAATARGVQSPPVRVQLTVQPQPPPDTTPPETKIAGSSKRAVHLRPGKSRVTVAVRFSSEPGARFECKLDGKPYRACASPKKLKLKAGKHVLRVRAIDRAGNVDPTPARVKIKVKR